MAKKNPNNVSEIEPLLVKERGKHYLWQKSMFAP